MGTKGCLLLKLWVEGIAHLYSRQMGGWFFFLFLKHLFTWVDPGLGLGFLTKTILSPWGKGTSWGSGRILNSLTWESRPLHPSGSRWWLFGPGYKRQAFACQGPNWILKGIKNTMQKSIQDVSNKVPGSPSSVPYPITMGLQFGLFHPPIIRGWFMRVFFETL